MSSCKLCNGSGWFYPDDDGGAPEPCDYCNYDDDETLDQWADNYYGVVEFSYES
jgi:hypothetical protein